MTLLEDTRNPIAKHANVHDFCEAVGITIVRSKLLVGDYTLPTNQSVCIDTKADLQEVCGNVCQQHKRFRAECTLAAEVGIRLIILVEHGGGIKTIDDVRRWHNPRLVKSPHATTGAQLAAIMDCMSDRYGVTWQFCRKQDTGRTIIELLTEGQTNE